MKTPILSALAVLLIALGIFVSARQTDTAPVSSASPAASVSATEAPKTPPNFQEAFQIISKSCMPCHNHTTLEKVITQAKAAKFESIEDESKDRIVAALEDLQADMQDGLPLSYTTEANMQRLFTVMPGELVLMLEHGVMPPPWAPELMKTIEWDSYQPLTVEKRIALLRYGRSNSKDVYKKQPTPQPPPKQNQ